MTDRITIERETLERLVRWIGGSREIIETDLFLELRAALAAQPAEQTAQEPVARLLRWCGPSRYPVPHGGFAARTYKEFPEADSEKPDSYWRFHAPLFLAAPPAPAAVPPGYALVPMAKLEQFRDAFAEELAAYDIDPPIHHVKQGHDDCVSLIAAAGEKI